MTLSPAFRPAELEDRDDVQFIVSTWSRAYKPARSAGVIASEDWEGVMHRQIRKLIARPDVLTVIAYEAEDPTFLYGFIAATPASSPQVVYFVYVKESFRREGCARGLFAAATIDPARRFAFTCHVPLLQAPGGGASALKQKIPLAYHEPNYMRVSGYVERTARSQQPWKR